MAGRRRKTDEQNEFNAALGMRIQKLREAKGMKPGELARQVDVTSKMMYQYETGLSGVPLHRLPLIAFVLGVSVAELIQSSILRESRAENA